MARSDSATSSAFTTQSPTSRLSRFASSACLIATLVACAGSPTSTSTSHDADSSDAGASDAGTFDSDGGASDEGRDAGDFSRDAGAPSTSCSLPGLTPNAWTPWIDLKDATRFEYPAGYAGRFDARWWNNLTAGRGKVFLLEGYYDHEAGGYRGSSIYANAIYAIDLEQRRVRLEAAGNWSQLRNFDPACYGTHPTDETFASPTPCDRHPYGSFHYQASSDSLYLLFGATSGLNYRNPGSDCSENFWGGEDLWRYEFASSAWKGLMRDERCTWCPGPVLTPRPQSRSTSGTKVASFPGESAIYASIRSSGEDGERVWTFDPASSSWTLLADVDVSPGGSNNWYMLADPVRRRLVIEVAIPRTFMGQKAAGFYSFDVASRSWARLEVRSGVAPQAAGLAYDSLRDVYVAANASGVSVYDPKTAAWTVATTAGVAPSPLASLTYDPTCDVIVARTGQPSAGPGLIEVFALRP